MDVKDRLFLAAFIVVAFIAGTVLIYKAGDYSREKEIEAIQNVLGSQRHKTMLAEARVLPEADWKIYKNEQYGFEFEYPQNWVLENNTEKNNYAMFKAQGKYGLVDALELVVEKTATRENENLDVNRSSPESDSSAITIGGKPGLKVYNAPYGGCYEAYFVNNKGYTYSLNRDSSCQIDDRVYKSILTSFKFIE